MPWPTPKRWTCTGTFPSCRSEGGPVDDPTKRKVRRVIRVLFGCAAFFMAGAQPVRPAEPCCSAPCLKGHSETGKLDICGLKDRLKPFVVLTNWGTKPEWLNTRQFVFLSNQVGDVYLMDVDRRTMRNLTGKFHHAGFTRAFRLNSGDLLLVGPAGGPKPPDDPLRIYDRGQFTGTMWLFEAPFDKPPYPVTMMTSAGQAVPVPAWEGIAVSRVSDRIVWSDTRAPFFGANLFQTGWNYFFKRSNLWSGVFVRRPGAAYIDRPRKIVSKDAIGAVFLEPQNFLGAHDRYVTFSAYGPSSSGASDTYLYDFRKNRVIRLYTGEGYEEWEGVAPDYSRSFVEIDADASRFVGPKEVELYLYDFAARRSSRFTFFQDEPQAARGVFLHEPVFSPDGKQALFATGGGGGWEKNSPGYGIGIVLLPDVEAYLKSLARISHKG